MSIRVLAPGLLTTLQDCGREAFRHLGVGSAGALDPWSHALANYLVGNHVDVATLEVTLSGPTLHFEAAARIALTGAVIDASVDGHPVPGARTVGLPAGCTLRLGACRNGARSYLAVSGGFALASVLGSTATDLRGGFGGLHGGALRTGDVLQLAQPAATVSALHVASWWVDVAPDDAASDALRNTAANPASTTKDQAHPVLIRVLAGESTTAPPDALFATPWHMTAASNRQGLRLDGPALSASDQRERTSEPVFPGTVQLPPDGRPIVLLADAQTHGGYPCIAHAIRADWPKLAQLRPGDTLTFVPCSRTQARDALRAQQQRLARIRLALLQRRSCQ